jgi:hypothetical protein
LCAAASLVGSIKRSSKSVDLADLKLVWQLQHRPAEREREREKKKRERKGVEGEREERKRER